MTIKKNQAIPFLISIIIFLIISFLYEKTRILDNMEWGSIDFRFFLRAPSEKNIKLDEGVRLGRINPMARKDLVILGIDEDTFKIFDSKNIQWPYPWKEHAKVINFISTGQPNSILVDIMFLEHKNYEDKLARSFQKAGNVFIDYQIEQTENIGYVDQRERMKLVNKLRWEVPANAKRSRLQIESLAPPTPRLIKAAKNVGFANVFPQGKINRTMPLVAEFNGHYYPNIDLVVIMHYYGIKKEDVEIKLGDYIKLKNIKPEKMTKPNDKGEITIPIDELGFMDVNYIGASGSYQNYSYYLFHRDGSMGTNTSLKDKIVMVAAFNLVGIAKDTHHSPYGTTYGIEHHANALNTILNQDFLYKFSSTQNILIMLIIAILLGFLLVKFSIVTSLIFTGALSILYVIGAFLLFDFASIITALATPLFQIGTTFTMIITYRLLTEQKEKRYIRQTFSKFVSKSVVDELLQDPEKIKLGGEKKILTVLFSDIRGFTSISERLTPEELVEHLNVYLQKMTEIVFKYFGTLDKYVGDEIMAFWGAPIPQADHALLSCKAALEMMIELHNMNKVWIENGKPELDIGIGLNTGDMVVGNMGSKSRMDYTLMGDNVNLGARLEGTNKVYKTNIIISEFTYEHVKDQVYVRELDLIRVKGKALPVKIFELMGIKD